MRTLFDEVTRLCGKNGGAIVKHLEASGIKGWEDLTRANLAYFRDHLVESVARSSAHTYGSQFCAVLGRYEDELGLPRAWREIMHVKNEKPLKTYLTMDELKKLEHVETKNQTEKLVLFQFLISSYTGMRISDVINMSEENTREGVLTYVSIKTKILTTVPLRPGVTDMMKWIWANKKEVCLMSYNRILRRLCKRAGITTTVLVRKGGVSQNGEKWKYISSHTGRVSFVTNLSKTGLPLLSISRLAGHSSIGMTERYIVPTNVELNAKAKSFFGI